MKVRVQRWLTAAGSITAGLFLLVSLECDQSAGRPAAARPHAARQSYIVQAASAAAAGAAVLRAGGHVGRELGVIRAVGAQLDPRELAALNAERVPQLAVYADDAVRASSLPGTLPETYYPSEVAARQLHVGGITGTGVTVAVV